MLTLESPHGGDSNEFTQYTIFNMNMKNTLNYPKSAAMGFIQWIQELVRNSRGNEPSVFEPLKFYCTYKISVTLVLLASAVLFITLLFVLLSNLYVVVDDSFETFS